MECGIKEKLSKAFLPEDIPRKEEIPLREMGKTDAISAVGAIEKVEFGKAVSFIGKRLILADIAST